MKQFPHLHRTAWALLILLLLLAGLGVQAFAAPGNPPVDIQAKMGAAIDAARPHAPDHVLVRLVPDATPEAGFVPVIERWYRAPTLPGETADQAWRRLAASPQIEKVELDYVMQLIPDSQQAAPDRIFAQSWGYEPDDPNFPDQWNFKDVQAPEAWQRGWTGSGVTVAVLDTGVWPGPDLACRSFADPVKIISGTVTTGLAAAQDDDGHGTHVTGAIAECTNNGFRDAGLAYDATIMPVKVLDANGRGFDSDVAQGIEWARTHGAKIINMSLGFDCGEDDYDACSSDVVDQAIDNAVNDGLLLVAAAGDDSNAHIDYPANHPDVMGISAVEMGLKLALYSDHGMAISMAAPGGDLNADLNHDGFLDGIEQETRHPGDSDWNVWLYEGTSIATPHVSAAAAMLWGAYPTATAAEIRTALENSALDIDDPGFDQFYGHGVLQIADAFCQLSGAACDDLVVNGDFETIDGPDQGWTMTNAEGAPYPAYTLAQQLTGSRSMYFGLNPPDILADGIQTPDYRKKSRIYQDVDIPADADDVFVDYWYMPCTEETPDSNPSASNDDWQRFRVYDPTEDPNHRTRDVIYMHTLENDCVWKHVTFKLEDSFKGHTMRFNFAVQNNYNSKETWMFLDRVRVIAYTYAPPPPTIDLSLTKTVDQSAPTVGDDVVFAITVTNSGPDDASGVQVTDLLPSGYAYVGDSGNGNYSSNTGLWDIGDLANGAAATLHITATVNASGVYTNVAEVSAANETDADSTPGNNEPAEDDQDSAVTTPAQPPVMIDLSLSKTVNNASPSVGDDVTFAITVTNSGPDDASGVQVTDLLPSGYAYVGDSGNGNYSSNTGLWDIGDLANGAAATLHITATVNASGVYTNVAEVSAANETDADSTPGNNDPAEDDQDSATALPVRVIDLSLTKQVSDSTPKMGSNVVFTLTVNNSGPDDASGVQVTDLLPSGYAYVGDSGNGNYSSNTGLWDIGDLANGAAATLHITATVNASGVYTNVAEVSAANETDADSTPGNNDPAEDDQDSAVTTPTPVIDLSLTKSVDNATPASGSQIVFEITVENNGPADASGVQVIDLLPSGYAYAGDDANGNYSSNTGLWDIGDLANGAAATLHITATVNASGVYTNVAEVSAANETDADSTPGNNDPAEDDQDSAVTMPKIPTIFADDINIAPGVPFSMPVSMKDFPSPGTGALTLEITFDPAVITPTSCEPDPDHLFDSALCNENYATGKVQMTFLSTTGAVGDHPLAKIGFTGNGAAGDSTPVTVTVATISNPSGADIQPYVATDDGSVTLGVEKGDVNCDDQVNSVDALFVLQHDVGLRSVSQQCPPPQGSLYGPACDVNNDSQCNSVDALLIMQCDVGIPNQLCPVTAMLGMTPHAPLQSASVAVGRAIVEQEDQVTIPVTADVVDASLGASTIELHYDASVVRPTACDPDPDNQFDSRLCNIDEGKQQITFNMISTSGVSGSIALANITFQAVGESGDRSPLTATARTFANTEGRDIPTQIRQGEIRIQDAFLFLPITTK